MTKRVFPAAFATAIGLLIVWLMWVLPQPNLKTQIGINFIGVTNNSAGLLGTSDRLLAVFSVTNGANSSIADEGFYYIERPGSWLTYEPLGSGGQIPPHGCTTILTRIPTNGVLWRVVVPYSRTGLFNQILGRVRDTLDRALKLPLFDFDRYGNGAPRSNWVDK